MADGEAQRGMIRAVLTPGVKVSGAVVNAGAVIKGSVAMPSMAQIPEYEGSYEVAPKLTDQTLETAQKKMAQDVLIKAVPVSITSNLGGGTTVCIAVD